MLLACYVSHFYLKDKPVWIMVIGNSSTGKSAIAFRSLEHLGTMAISDLSPSSLLSGFGEQMGILENLKRHSGGNGILTMSDFSPVLDSRPEDLAHITAQLRKVFDGEYSKWTGNKKEMLAWRGKVTMIAGATNEIERRWAVNRSLGERFLTLRWKCGDEAGIVDAALNHLGKEPLIDRQMKKLVQEFVDFDTVKGIKGGNNLKVMEALIPVSKFVAHLRVHVRKESHGKKRTIVGDSGTESPTRIIKSLAVLAKGNATLFRKNKVDEEDVRLAGRLALDSLPAGRISIIKELMNSDIETREWASLNGIVSCLNYPVRIPPTSAFRIIQDLEYLGFIECQTRGATRKKMIRLSGKAIEEMEPIWGAIEDL